jgi:hypothetical protein
MGHIGLCYFEDFNVLDGNVKTLINKKFWEELRAYFPLIRHGPQRKPKELVGTHRHT